ncbi:response regulator [Roseomonas sp. 18066]|uniref:response regulator n=1 Tax=Roseomonas sp. 18066 TaxID=2681412 RepID=UPI0013571DDE|nr:response regulator [Roseomonas sp. 18066]
MNRLLLVEDEIMVRTVTREVFEEGGFEVVEAGTGDEAIRLLDHLDQVDILVTDVRMPGRCDGVDVVHHARFRFPQIPVIVATGYAANIRERLKPFSPEAVLIEKPYRLDRLAALARHLSGENERGIKPRDFT